MTEKTFTLTVNEAALNIIGAALGELPFKVAAPIVNDLNRQIQGQAVEAKRDQADVRKLA